MIRNLIRTSPYMDLGLCPGIHAQVVSPHFLEGFLAFAPLCAKTFSTEREMKKVRICTGWTYRAKTPMATLTNDSTPRPLGPHSLQKRMRSQT
jgi:hypothetical protein